MRRKWKKKKKKKTLPVTIRIAIIR